MHLIDFIKKELDYTCEVCHIEKYEKQITCEAFKFCFDCSRIICPNCVKSHKKKHNYIVPSYEIHLKNKHKQKKLFEEIDPSNQIETIGDKGNENKINENYENNKYNDKSKVNEKKDSFDYKPSEKDIEIIKNKNLELKNRIKSLRLLIKMNNILLKTYEKHPDNYYNNKNITNVANSIINNGGITYEIDEKDSDIRINKINRLLLDIINTKLQTNLNENSINIDLNNKSIGNEYFKRLSCIRFNKLEELKLENNNLSNIDSLSIFNAPKLKTLDLSSNKISNIFCLRNASSGIPNLEKLLLNANQIKNIDILNDSIFPLLKGINLDNNNIDYNLSKNKKIIQKYNKND